MKSVWVDKTSSKRGHLASIIIGSGGVVELTILDTLMIIEDSVNYITMLMKKLRS